MNVVEKMVIRAIARMTKKTQESAGWVCETETEVNVGRTSEFAIGTSGFAPKNAIVCSFAKVYGTRKKAEEENRDIKSAKVIKAEEFFKRELMDAKNALTFIKYYEIFDQGVRKHKKTI